MGGEDLKSILQGKRQCYITGDTYGLHKHHIFRGPNRKAAEEYGCWVWLRWDWHNGSDYGVHGQHGKDLDLRLKRECQRKFEELHGHDLFMMVFGRNYLEDE